MSKSLAVEKPICGGMEMRPELYWQLFLETGSPEAYLMYSEAKRLEQINVPKYEWPGCSGHTIQ